MDEDQIVRQYGKLKNLRVVASINKTSADVIRKVLEKRGIRLMTKVECKLSINRENDFKRN